MCCLAKTIQQLQGTNHQFWVVLGSHDLLVGKEHEGFFLNFCCQFPLCQAEFYDFG